LDASPDNQTLVFVLCLPGIGHRPTPIIAIQIQHRVIPNRSPRTAIRAIAPIAPGKQAAPRIHPRQENKFSRILIFLYPAY
jgi:hypothetical protein